MLIVAATSALLSAPFLADVPVGTDAVIHVQLGPWIEEMAEAWWELEPLLDAHPRWVTARRMISKHWVEPWQRVQSLTGADFTRKGAAATLALDLDAKGAVVASGVIRGSFGGGPPTPPPAGEAKGLEELHIAGRPVAWDRGLGLGWTRVDGGTLVLGTRRGLQRQLRTLGATTMPDKPMEPMRQVVARTRRPMAPVVVAWARPAGRWRRWETLSTVIHTIVPEASGILLTADAGDLRVRVISDDEEARAPTEHVLRALAAFARGGPALLESGAELMLSTADAAVRRRVAPGRVYDEDLGAVLDGWLRGFQLTSKVVPRGPRDVELALTPSSMRGIVATLVYGLASGGDEVLFGRRTAQEAALFALRRAERAHQALTGRFLACGPTPRVLPQRLMPWPRDPCFDQLRFVPGRLVDFQISATTLDDTLVLVLRADDDGDGIPTVLYLTESVLPCGKQGNARQQPAGARLEARCSAARESTVVSLRIRRPGVLCDSRTCSRW